MYVMIQNLKLQPFETSSKNRFQTEYFTEKREKELHNVQFLGNPREEVCTYDHFHQIVQNLLSITYYECNVKQTKTVLMRMDVLKNLNFHYIYDVSQN